jgi:nitroimidazol reductase NimA-like FMN-containing flavoprotein (pyridoxamine 5'-phosphate oxidase superfamily)
MSERTTLGRKPDREVTDQSAIHAVLDEGLIAHVGLVTGTGRAAHPVVIPMLYARDGDRLLLHGSPASRLLRTAKAGVDVSVTITLLDALVLARSGFHHSMNYRSVVVFGTAVEITDWEKKVAALDRLVEHAVPGRMSALRPHNDNELRGTTVLVLPLAECSMKVRSGPPIDDQEDLVEDAWAGLIPIHIGVGTPEPDQFTVDTEVPSHVAGWSRGPANTSSN